MQGPKCRLCEKNHYGDCDPKDLPETDWFTPTKKEVVKQPTKAANKPEKQTKSEPAPKKQDKKITDAYDPGAVDRAKRWQVENRERYNERMRDYMRRYRQRLREPAE